MPIFLAHSQLSQYVHNRLCVQTRSLGESMLKKFALAIVISVACVGFANAATTDYVAKDVVTVIDLGATACIPCKMMAPVLEKVREDYKGRASVVFIDVWKTPEVGKEFGIRSIPTQIFYNKKGVEIQRHEGFLDEESMKAILDQLISEK